MPVVVVAIGYLSCVTGRCRGIQWPGQTRLFSGALSQVRLLQRNLVTISGEDLLPSNRGKHTDCW